MINAACPCINLKTKKEKTVSQPLVWYGMVRKRFTQFSDQMKISMIHSFFFVFGFRLKNGWFFVWMVPYGTSPKIKG